MCATGHFLALRKVQYDALFVGWGGGGGGRGNQRRQGAMIVRVWVLYSHSHTAFAIFSAESACIHGLVHIYIPGRTVLTDSGQKDR